MFDKKLFGLEKNGDVKVWWISVYTADHASGNSYPLISISHGKEGGKLINKQEWVLEGKQGRTAYEQAVSQAESRIKKQLDKNYRESKEELFELPVLAMLAKDASMEKLEKVKFKYEEGLYISDKLDGFRLLAKYPVGGEITLESRTGQPYDVPHIIEELKLIMEPGDIIDGELYVHGPILQDISSAVKRTDPQEKIDEAYLKASKALSKFGAESEKYITAKAEYDNAVLIAEIRPQLEFRVFDVIKCSGPTAVDLSSPFVDRLNALAVYSGRFIQDHVVAKVFSVGYRIAFTIEELRALHAEAVARGYEGVMIRTPEGVYESGKRSAGLYKFKMFMDAEFKIEDVIADKQGRGVFVLKNNLNNQRFTCVMGTMEQRTEYLANKELYIGKWLKVQFQSRYKGTLLPQFPTGLMVRECDEFGNPVE